MKMNLLSILFTALFLFLNQNAVAQSSSMTAQEWLEDLHELEHLIRMDHAKPFWLTNENDFETLLAKTKENIIHKEMTQEQYMVELLKVIACIKDGHSSMRGGDRYDQFGYLPFEAAWFGKDLHIVKAHDAYRKVLGSKILKVGNQPISKVLKQLRLVVPHANESRFKKFSPYYLHLPGLLYGLGITDSPKSANFLLEDEDGAVFSYELKQMDDDDESKMESFDWDLNPTPLYRQQREKAYWFEYLEKDKLLYLKYNRVTSMDEENIWAFSARLFQFVEQHDIEKFVVDIRDNGGGNNAMSTSLWHGIANNKKINRRGKLFVITGYKTFSAAISFASYLELRTKAIFVGTEVCDYVNSPGDAETYRLSNSKIEVGLSDLFHDKSFYLDERSSIFPDHEVELSWNDFSRGIDPILNFILDYQEETKETSIANQERYLGKYAFSPFQTLDVIPEGEGLKIEIAGKANSPLYPSGNNQFSTEVNGLILNYKEKFQSIELKYPDGKTRILKKVNDTLPTPYELITTSRFAELETALLKLQQTYPESQFWKDHSLATLATEVYYDLKGAKGREEARKTVREILNIAIRINPDKNDFAKVALEYY